MTEIAAGADAGPTIDAEGRPTLALPTAALVRISLFWLGLTAIDAVVNTAVQTRLRFDGLAEPGTVGTSLAIVAAALFLFSVVVQPTVGAISDYTTTRWGRLQVLGGVRMEETQVQSTGWVYDRNETGPPAGASEEQLIDFYRSEWHQIDHRRKYRNWFPGVHLRYEFNPNLRPGRATRVPSGGRTSPG